MAGYEETSASPGDPGKGVAISGGGEACAGIRFGSGSAQGILYFYAGRACEDHCVPDHGFRKTGLCGRYYEYLYGEQKYNFYRSAGSDHFASRLSAGNWL